jgi:hypothetical protein
MEEGNPNISLLKLSKNNGAELAGDLQPEGRIRHPNCQTEIKASYFGSRKTSQQKQPPQSKANNA